ncbi:hypothetical protein M493_09465 [Geobacillus genomosp. 3]|uniref:Uncharacterized protein n=1 Tax=Geobacillus genomosp. 3 TaxID=1921421 RepID=S5ZD53_GEOG3|nr:hypothetical protein M493_09465 [Geobacillus genomosp. 3]
MLLRGGGVLALKGGETRLMPPNSFPLADNEKSRVCKVFQLKRARLSRLFPKTPASQAALSVSAIG